MADQEWTPEQIRILLQLQFDEMRRQLDERYDTQTKAIDTAFEAQRTAMSTALQAADRAIQTAMVAAEKAALKAETATERRFDSVNEWRDTVTDITANNVTKAEARAVDERQTLAIERNTQDIRALTDRQNLSQGRGSGLDAGWIKLVGAVGLISTLAGLAVVVVKLGG